MTAPERIWATTNGIQPLGGSAGLWRSDTPHDATEYIRADLAAVPAQVEPDCCDICRGKTFAETADGKGWRCVECKAIWLRETQPDPRDEVIALAITTCRIIDDAVKEGYDTVNGLMMHLLEAVEPARSALAAAKAVQHD